MRIYVEMETSYNINKNNDFTKFLSWLNMQKILIIIHSSIIWLQELQRKFEDCFVDIGKYRATF